MNKWITAKLLKQGCKAPYGLMKQAAKTASTLISEVIAGFLVLCEVLLHITIAFVGFCAMFWLWQFVILALISY